MLFFFINHNYNFTNIGNSSVTDPLQDITLKVVWEGTITNDPTIWKYTVNFEPNQVTIGSTIPSNISVYNTPDQAKAAWRFGYYLKHRIENNIVTESYACSNLYDNSPTYCLRGGVDESLLDEQPVYNANVDLLNSTNLTCFNNYGGQDYSCTVIAVNKNGNVYAGSPVESYCTVQSNGKSFCYKD